MRRTKLRQSEPSDLRRGRADERREVFRNDSRFSFSSGGAQKSAGLTGAKLQAFRARLAKQLAAANPDSFQPSLAKLDAMVQDFRIQ